MQLSFTKRKPKQNSMRSWRLSISRMKWISEGASGRMKMAQCKSAIWFEKILARGDSILRKSTKACRKETTHTVRSVQPVVVKKCAKKPALYWKNWKVFLRNDKLYCFLDLQYIKMLKSIEHLTHYWRNIIMNILEFIKIWNNFKIDGKLFTESIVPSPCP